MNSAVARYLPKLLRHWIHEHPEIDHSRSTHTGILLFADTSGFTVLTRNLSQQGRVGDEYLTDLLNTLFNSLADVVARYDGDILKFSGDAVWCYFREDVRLIDLYAEMLGEIENINREQEICRSFPLSLHAGAATGSFELLSIATDSGRAEFEISGSIVVEAYRACDLAKAGEICLAPTLRSDSFRISPGRVVDGYAVVTPAVRVSDTPSPSIVRSEVEDEVDARLSRYVPESLLQRILDNNNQATTGSEHRRVHVVFVNVQSTSVEAKADDLQIHLSKIMNAVQESAGVTARIDPFGAGHKVLALFGAIVSTGSDALRALRAASGIAEIRTNGFESRVGIAAGALLCGEVGSRNRCEFTVMGNAVNLAARLMGKADPNSLLLDEVFFGEVKAFCQAEPQKLQLKGFDLPVTVHAFTALSERRGEIPEPRQFFGRARELAQLRALISDSHSSGPGWIALTGAAGIGKTSLTAKAVSPWNSEIIFYFDASTSYLRSGGWLIRELLQRALGRDSSTNLAESLAPYCESQWLPLLLSLGNTQRPSMEAHTDLTPELRIAKVAELTASCLSATLAGKIVILDNLESLDSLSLAILKSLLSQLRDTPAAFILIDNLNAWDAAGTPLVNLPLEGLSAPELREWFDTILVEGKRESDLVTKLTGASAGNPLFVAESLQFLIESGALAHITDPTRYEVVSAAGDMILSGRLEELQLARFDQLPESQRSLLKAAAVCPHQFNDAILNKLRPELAPAILLGELEKLCESGIIVRPRSTGPMANCFTFARETLRETIYNRTPVLQLQSWHTIAAEYLKQLDPEAAIYELAYHLARSQMTVEAFSYNLKAAKKATEAGLPIEASRYYRECSSCLKKISPASIASSERFSFYRHAAEFYLGEGDYGRVLGLVSSWRRLARSNGDRRELHAAAGAMAHLFWKQSRYNLCRPTLRYINREFQHSGAALLIDSHALQGELLRRTGKIREAQEACQMAVRMAESIGDTQRLPHALNNLGLAFWTGGNLEAATHCFERCVTLHESSNSHYLEARAANNLAIISEERGDYRRARDLARRARQIFADYGDRRNQSYASGNLANLQVHAGRLAEAIELFTTADRIFEHLGETHPHFYTVGNLGDIDLILGRLPRAQSKYDKVLAFARTAGDTELEAETAVRITECAFYGGQSEGVREMYENAIRIAREAGSLEYQTRGTVGLCRFLIGARDAEAANAQIANLIAFAEAAKSLRSSSEAEFLQGELHRITDNLDRALACYAKCAEYARGQEQFELHLKSLARLAEYDPANSSDHRREMADLLGRFSVWNGNTMLQELLNSRYYRYFRRTIIEALKAESMASSRQTVG
jgi:class 3 adenylate cyclase/tetratricopeptide (TPR) repeat protein